MTLPLLLALLLLAVALWRWLSRGVERCPDCGLKRDDGYPICDCGHVFEYPEDDSPLEYGDPEDAA